MRSIVLALKRYKLKAVDTQGIVCPGGNPHRPVRIC